jgi:hypothetical protein
VGIAVFFVVGSSLMFSMAVTGYGDAAYDCPQPGTIIALSAPPMALSSIYLSANNRNGLLINWSCIPCLEGGEIGFSRLASGPCAPTVSLEEVGSRGQRVRCDVEVSADAIV